jgi:hypothetical protein
MAYTLNKTNGDLLTVLADGTTDTSTTNLTLVGKNATSYGEAINENFVKLMENFSSSTAPSVPQQGQLWWDSINKQLAVYQGTAWKVFSHAVPSATAPSAAPTAGDLWWDIVNGQLRGYTGSAWSLIGPQTPIGAATTDFQGNAATDTLSASHTVGNVIVNNKLAAIFSTDATVFTPAFTYPSSGITKINPGLNFTSTAESTAISTPNATFGVSSGNVQITALTTNYGFNVTANVGGTPRSVLYVSGATGDVTFNGNVNFPTANPVTISNVSSNISPTANGTQNLGSTSSYWNQLYVRDVNALGNISVGGTAAVTGATTLNSTLAVTGTATLNSTLAVTGATTLSSTLAVTGKATLGNVVTTDGLFWANGVNYSTTITPATSFTSVASDITPAANLTFNLGSPAAYWNNVYGKAIQAQYADLAERFESDGVYSPGTVVELGGPAEITTAVEELSENVFGVISTRAAYLMNSGAGTNQTHPPIAVQGRVPVRVIGRIRKGDRLVSAGNGMARAGLRSEITTWNVIGRALEDKLDDGIGEIEAVVKLNS